VVSVAQGRWQRKHASSTHPTKACAEWGLQELSLGLSVVTEAQLQEWVINSTGSYCHFVGS
jgi:hypothetical protein